jgi:hypothetical protein
VRSRLLDGSGEVVRHAAATLMTRCDEQMVALPRLGAALAACSIMLTAAQTTLPLEGGAANFDAGMSTRTLCALSVKWAAADGPQQGLYFKSIRLSSSATPARHAHFPDANTTTVTAPQLYVRPACRKSCLAFVVQAVELVSRRRTQLKAITDEATDVGLFVALTNEVEDRSSRQDTRQVDTSRSAFIPCPPSIDFRTPLSCNCFFIARSAGYAGFSQLDCVRRSRRLTARSRNQAPQYRQ